jgi:hypothetical protein
MTGLVPPEGIERIVGIARHRDLHYGRAVSCEQTVYILHPKSCLASGIDLRDCDFSAALDRGIDLGAWSGYEDSPVQLIVLPNGELVPRQRLDNP